MPIGFGNCRAIALHGSRGGIERHPPGLFGGETILLPEAELQAIEMLRSRFNASTLHWQAGEYEFATKARVQGVPVELLRLGQAVHECTGQSAEEMVRVALEQPSATLLAWSALYRSSMSPH